MSVFASKKNKTEEATEMESRLKKKTVVMIGSLCLLALLIIGGTVAWYTRLNNISGITLDVAKTDLLANYAKDASPVNVADYITVVEKKAAPGTSGVVPVRLSTTSETDLNYTLTIDYQGVAPEFLQRVRFYYYTEETEGGQTYYQKHLLGGKRCVYTKTATGYTRNKQTDPLYDETAEHKPLGNAVLGTLHIPSGTATETALYEYVYWEWVYEWDQDDCYDLEKGTWGAYRPTAAEAADADLLAKNIEAYKLAHDEVDTALGLQEYDLKFESKIDKANYSYTVAPKTEGDTEWKPAYQRAMMIQVNVEGVSAEPILASTQGDEALQEAIDAAAEQTGGISVYVNENDSTLNIRPAVLETLPAGD